MYIISVMSEFNDISTDNIATRPATEAKPATEAQAATWTSDELDAPLVYEKEKRTLYAKSRKLGKAIRTVTIVTGATLVAGGGIFGLNKILGQPPSATNVSMTVSGQNIQYAFTIANQRKNIVTFTVSLPNQEEPLFKLDVSNPQKYEGTAGPFSAGINVVVKIMATNNIDYLATLYSKEYAIPA